MIQHQRNTRDDRGSVLPMVLVLMVVGSLTVVALLTFASTLVRTRPAIAVRDETFLTAKSAMEMAIAFQRQEGPDGCFTANVSTPPIELNGYTATVTCTPTGNYYGTARGRLGIVTTGNDPVANQIRGGGASAAVKAISGDVFVNGGTFDATSVDLAVIGGVTMSDASSVATEALRYQGAPGPATSCADPLVAASIAFPNPGTSWAGVCQSLPWWNFVGDENTVGGGLMYPDLPPLPTFTRDSQPQATIGTCNIYYPGRYQDVFTLGAGRHYFASGVYYFENVVTLSPGAVVVAGEGRWEGCTVDAAAIYAPGAPSSPEITGRGATFLLGGAGRVVTNDASLSINRRVSDSNTRGSEATAIRSINFLVTAPVGVQATEIPEDVVHVADTYDAGNSACSVALGTDRCRQAAADHTVQAGPLATPVGYTTSTLTPADDIISINQTGGTVGTNQVVADGYVFVPNARVQASGGSNGNYRLRLAGGIVASGVGFDYQQAPSAGNWVVGVLDEPIQRQVSLFVEVVAPNGVRTISRATVEVNIDGSYAINSWTVDPALSSS